MVYILGAALPEGVSGHDMGRRLLRELWCRHGVGALPEILTEPMGKPYFVTGGFHFSITHTKRNAFCALAAVPVGLDAEELTRRVNPALAKKILSPGEKAQYDRAADQNRALLTFWVLKEAAGKRTGQGIGSHPTHTNFMLTDSRVFEADGCLIALLTQEENHAL